MWFWRSLGKHQSNKVSSARTVIPRPRIGNSSLLSLVSDEIADSLWLHAKRPYAAACDGLQFPMLDSSELETVGVGVSRSQRQQREFQRQIDEDLDF
jgi:hypothetical protein